ncbi:PspC domain-containing protein [Isoptericola croceus]|uniref:PspC domain-containing protein n=1 Tax=Isoptericola croceus TaxID=3031406 RepID=UPI0023F7956E|nr:PspC domain-containing protein [Isoptericola croceus]
MTTNDTPAPDAPGGAPGAGGTDGGAAPPSPPPRRAAGDGFFDSVRHIGIARSDDRWVGGVAAGIAERLRLDPLLVRGLLILSFFVSGAGLVLYGVAWALLPERSDGRIHFQEAIRGTFDVAMLGAGIAVLLGLIWGGGFWPWWIGPAEWVSALLWIAFWVAVVWLIVKLVRSRGRPVGPTPPPPAGSTSPAAYGAPAAAVNPVHGPPSSPNQSEVPVSSTDPYVPAPRAHYAPPAAAPVPGSMPEASTAPFPPAGPAGPTGGGYGAQPYPGPPVPPAPLPPRPRRTVGGNAVGIVVGLALLAGAGLLAADLVLGFAVPVWPVWVGSTIVIVGAGIVVAGVRGLRGGWLTAFAWGGLVTALAVWPFAADRGAWQWQDHQVTTQSGALIGEGTLTPRSIEAAEDGVRVQFGEAYVDLTKLDLTDVEPGEPVVVPVDMTGGRTVVEIPADTAVEIVAEINAGNLAVEIDGEHTVTSGFSGGPRTYQTDEVSELGGAVLRLEVDGRAGEIFIKEER